MTRSPVPFVSIEGHGFAYCAMDGYLCTQRDDGSSGQSCMDGFDCYFPQSPRIPARQLKVEVAFLDCCRAANVLDGLVRGHNIVLDLLDGYTCAVIAPNLLTHPMPLAPFFVWAMLAEGRSLGELTSLLNGLVLKEFGHREQYILFGDPRMIPFPDCPQTATPVEAEEHDSDRWSIRLPVSGATVQRFACAHPSLLRAAKSSPLHAIFMPPGKTGFVRVLPADTRGAELCLLAVLPADAGAHVNITVTSRPPFDDELLAVASRVLQNVTREGGMEAASDASRDGFLRAGDNGAESGRDTVEPVSAADELLAKLSEIEWRVAATLRHPVLSSRLYMSLREAEDEVASLCDRAAAELVSEMVMQVQRSGLRFCELYARDPGASFLRRDRLSETCSICGARLYRYVYQVGVWSPRIRHVLECEQCLILSDNEEDEAPVWLRLADTVALGRTAEVVLTGRNTQDVPALVHAAVAVNPTFEVEPAIASLLVRPRQSFDFTFAVTPFDSVRVHRHRFHGVLSVNGKLALAERLIKVRPPPT
ncbi:MAG: hypothetical protein AB1486_02895 [Planctomycetota bacterium]